MVAHEISLGETYPLACVHGSDACSERAPCQVAAASRTTSSSSSPAARHVTSTCAPDASLTPLSAQSRTARWSFRVRSTPHSPARRHTARRPRREARAKRRRHLGFACCQCSLAPPSRFLLLLPARPGSRALRHRAVIGCTRTALHRFFTHIHATPRLGSARFSITLRHPPLTLKVSTLHARHHSSQLAVHSCLVPLGSHSRNAFIFHSGRRIEI